MADRLALATRVMKARRRSNCPACRRLILPGMQIARLTDPPEWIHLACVEVVQALQLVSKELGGEVIAVFDEGAEWPSNRLGRSGLAKTAAASCSAHRGGPPVWFPGQAV